MEIAHANRGGQFFGFKLAGIGIFHKGVHMGDVRQQSGENGGGHFPGRAGQNFLPVKGGNRLGHIQSAVGGKTLQHGFRAGGGEVGISGRVIEHNFGLRIWGIFLPIAQKPEDSRENLGFLVQLKFDKPYDILFLVKKQVFSNGAQLFFRLLNLHIYRRKKL
jgi:hypothetical protein